MTRTQAKMVAEELYKLVKKDKDFMATIMGVLREATDEYLNTREAAEFIGMSVGYIKKHLDEIPHIKVGRVNKFKKSLLVDYMNRENFRIGQ